MLSYHKLTATEKYILHQADNGVIFSHRLSEWCGQAPELEIEMSLANIALDHLGQARLWLDTIIQEVKKKKIIITEDDLAYLRDDHEFTNLALLEQPNGDFAMTVAKIFFYSVYLRNLFTVLQKHDFKLNNISAIATKSLPENGYHEKFSRHWMEVLIGGTEESHKRMAEAVKYLWPYCGEFFKLADYEEKFFQQNDLLDLVEGIKSSWIKEVSLVLRPLSNSQGVKSVLEEGLPAYLPAGKEGHHGEHLSYLLNEFQSLHRSHQDVKW